MRPLSQRQPIYHAYCFVFMLINPTVLSLVHFANGSETRETF